MRGTVPVSVDSVSVDFLWLERFCDCLESSRDGTVDQSLAREFSLLGGKVSLVALTTFSLFRQ